MNGLQIFENTTFGNVRVINRENEPWFVAKDVCTCLGLTNPTMAVNTLDEDERTKFNLGRQGNTNLVNEYGLYSLVLSSRKKEAKDFKRWITHEVIPKIRKTGSYSLNIPKTLPEALRAYATEVEEHEKTKTKVARQDQQIAEFKPVKDYVDKILSSKSTVTATQIAADYGISARKLNVILHEEGVQRSVCGQWILYQKHMHKGWTKSETFEFERSDGRMDSKINTKWTQKGRLAIHEILTARGIHAVCEEIC